MFTVLTVFIINFVVVINGQQNNQCTGRMDGIIFPDFSNCDSFIQCQSGSVVPNRCPSGTLFDLNLYFCVPAHVVNCGLRMKPNTIGSNNPRPNPPSPETHHDVCRSHQNGSK